MKYKYEVTIITDNLNIISTVHCEDIEFVLEFVTDMVRNNNVISFEVKLITI